MPLLDPSQEKSILQPFILSLTIAKVVTASSSMIEAKVFLPVQKLATFDVGTSTHVSTKKAFRKQASDMEALSHDRLGEIDVPATMNDQDCGLKVVHCLFLNFDLILFAIFHHSHSLPISFSRQMNENLMKMLRHYCRD